MIGSHPGGSSLTQKLIALSGLEPPASILDLGAGNGESVQYLQELGFAAVGIDQKPGRENVRHGDIRMLPYTEGSMDVCLAECSFSVCMDAPLALREAYRVLKAFGSLLLSDVYFKKEPAPCLSMPAPLTMDCWRRETENAGFCIRRVSDATGLWRDFFLESLWNGNADARLCDFFREAGKSGCGYFLAWLQKGETNGSV